jgi:hypothetical protein
MVNSLLGHGREGGVYTVTNESNYKKSIVKEFIEREDFISNSKALAEFAEAGYPVAKHRKSKTGHFLIYEVFEGIAVSEALEAANIISRDLVNRIKTEFELLSRTHKGIYSFDVILDINTGELKMVDSTDGL